MEFRGFVSGLVGFVGIEERRTEVGRMGSDSRKRWEIETGITGIGSDLLKDWKLANRWSIEQMVLPQWSRVAQRYNLEK
ncbi:hypothetical protein JTB14_019612 [Gonioctena quinquepunctata]|nr:hypothetical protein JTB14_019612 [Gonioctena quinquepunctata]